MASAGSKPIACSEASAVGVALRTVQRGDCAAEPGAKGCLCAARCQPRDAQRQLSPATRAASSLHCSAAFSNATGAPAVSLECENRRSSSHSTQFSKRVFRFEHEAPLRCHRHARRFHFVFFVASLTSLICPAACEKRGKAVLVCRTPAIAQKAAADGTKMAGLSAPPESGGQKMLRSVVLATKLQLSANA